jgi:hypothetical protein
MGQLSSANIRHVEAVIRLTTVFELSQAMTHNFEAFCNAVEE